MLSKRPAKGGEAFKLSKETQASVPSRASTKRPRAEPAGTGSRSSKPSPTSTLPASASPSFVLKADVPSEHTYRSRTNALKAAADTAPPEEPAILDVSSFARSSVRQASSLLVSSCSLPSQSANSSAFALLPLVMPLNNASAVVPEVFMCAINTLAMEFMKVDASRSVLSSASKSLATDEAYSTSFCSKAVFEFASCTNFCATNRCSRSVHCFESFASSTWHCVNLPWSLANSAVTGPLFASLEFLASCTRIARNFLASATAACASASVPAISSQIFLASSWESWPSPSSGNLVMVFASFWTAASTLDTLCPDACI
mmetsp:Transcript_107408/g.269410  ORF Transcript_107408/g.269410 Transcript_107408/m.269410 type:complete len:316 (-) Transcript_107408:2782-3729(-)